MVDSVSFDPDSLSDAEKEETREDRELLEEILKVLERIEAHLAEITEEEITDDDID